MLYVRFLIQQLNFLKIYKKFPDNLETEIKYFTQENGTKVFAFYLDGELVKEATINPLSDRIGMRSKIHPRDFTQKDMLLDMNISSTSAVNKYNKIFFILVLAIFNCR